MVFPFWPADGLDRRVFCAPGSSAANSTRLHIVLRRPAGGAGNAGALGGRTSKDLSLGYVCTSEGAVDACTSWGGDPDDAVAPADLPDPSG